MIQACYQRANVNRGLENWVSSITLNVYQIAGNAIYDYSRQPIENQLKIHEIRRFSNKNLMVEMMCIVQ